LISAISRCLAHFLTSVKISFSIGLRIQRKRTFDSLINKDRCIIIDLISGALLFIIDEVIILPEVIIDCGCIYDVYLVFDVIDVIFCSSVKEIDCSTVYAIDALFCSFIEETDCGIVYAVDTIFCSSVEETDQ
ncbi:5144_t:CDS:2, partial [Funneliformis caledonium]